MLLLGIYDLLKPHANDRRYHDGKLDEATILEIANDSGPQLKTRNEKWLVGNQGPEYFNIYQLHEQINDSLFMVGAAHLFGEFGILHSLLQNNYSVEKLDDDLNAAPLTEEMLHSYMQVTGDSNA